MIDLINISLQFGGKYLFENVNFKINSGDKISLVGANGSGKTSILKIISGELEPENGKISRQKGINIGYLPQDMVVHEGKSLADEAKSALTDIVLLQEKEMQLTNRLNENDVIENERDDLVNQLGEVHHRLEELDSYSAESRIEKILLGLGFSEEDFNLLTDEFSGGWQMRIALAKILISQNDILLLDEPTNHLDIDSLEWLISFLKNYKGALLIVSHDKHFINEVTSKTLEIYLRKFNSFNGNYDAYFKFKTDRDILIENQYLQQQKKIKETERFIERFRYKATKAKQVQSRIKQLEKINLVELPESTSEINMRFPSPPPSGKVNIELKSLSKSFGSKKIFSDLEFTINRGDKIAFVGPNGAGKTTLAKIIAGELNFDSGKRILGHNTIISYYAQDVAENLNPDLDILETVEGINEEKTLGQLRSLLGSFLFTGDDVFKRVGVLSGGEKSRVALTKILLTKANFIILDEPTNHLDISSKEVLQRALKDFTGSLILVSHDIDFLNTIVNKVAEIRKNEIKIYEGGIDYFLYKKKESTLPSDKSVSLKSESVQKKKEINLPALSENNFDAISRKDQKRIEAKIRQKKYSATKNLIKEIKSLEKIIEELENKEKELERNLLNPSIYKNTKLTFEMSNEFNNVKNELESKLTEWSRLSEKLHEAEKQFALPENRQVKP